MPCHIARETEAQSLSFTVICNCSEAAVYSSSICGMPNGIPITLTGLNVET
jgi:hypothetical protein